MAPLLVTGCDGHPFVFSSADVYPLPTTQKRFPWLYALKLLDLMVPLDPDEVP